MRKVYNLVQTAWFQVVLITFIGFILRLWGVFHGFQENFLYHPDSSTTLGGIWDYYLGLDLMEKSHAGQVYNFIMILVLWACESFIGFLGYQVNWSIEFIGSAASLTSAWLGTATIPIVFLLGNRAYNKTTGVLSAAFLSVCPLHSFHSHYPYRDIPMIFVLVITLYLCVVILEKPSLLNLALGSLAALVTAAMKPAGIVVFAPFLVAFIIGTIRLKKFWLLISFCIAFLSINFFLLSFRFGTNSLIFYISQLSQSQIGLFQSLSEIFRTLRQWIGLPFLMALSAGIGYGVWRFRPSDIIFIVFLTSASLAVATAYYTDERFLIFLLPCGMVLLARAIAEIWKASSQGKILRIILATASGGLLVYSLTQSAWQGIMLSLPDTRFLSGKWAAAHLPAPTKISTEGYYPLRINERPNVFFFDISQPVKEEAKKADLFITSSIEHQRYFEFPYRFPQKKVFYETLKKQELLLKEFSLNNFGFIHSTIKVYSTHPFNDHGSFNWHNSFSTPVPRPYDAGWNGGVSFLEHGPLDRDDRTFELGWGHRVTSTLVSPITGQEMVVFMVNGSEKSVVKVRVGYTTKIRTLKPGEFHILRFRPKWFFPKKPALYHFEAGMPVGKKVLVQLRCGNREIGEAYAKWGDYEKAVTYLKQALAEDPNNPEVGLLLSTNYEKLGKGSEARQIVLTIKKRNPEFIDRLLLLGKSDLSARGWEQVFQGYTGLKPSLLTSALTQEFTIDKAFPSRSGKIKEDCRASGGKTITYEKTGQKPDEVMHGPYLFLDQGAFRAGFFLRTWDVKGAGPLAVIKVLADDKVISMQSVSIHDFKNDADPFKEIQIPFVNAHPRAEIKFQVFATGVASFAVDRIRIEPDLRKTYQEKLLNLKMIAGDSLRGKDQEKGVQ
jgi:tetratricopeptide (TPR) repeat protein